MIKRVWPILVALLALTGGVALQLWLAARREPPPAITLPATQLLDLQGRPQGLNTWPGKVVMLNFWASWCEPCREEIPALNRLQQQYGSQGLQIVGVAIDDLDAVREFQGAVPMTYPVLLAPDQGIALMEKLGNRFGVLPYTVIFDRQGRMVYSHPGAITQPEVEKTVAPLLSAAARKP